MTQNDKLQSFLYLFIDTFICTLKKIKDLIITSISYAWFKAKFSLQEVKKLYGSSEQKNDNNQTTNQGAPRSFQGGYSNLKAWKYLLRPNLHVKKTLYLLLQANYDVFVRNFHDYSAGQEQQICSLLAFFVVIDK